MLKKGFTFIFFLVQLTCAYADAVKFTAKLSHSVVELGQRFQITFTLNTEGKKFIPPPFYKFRVLSGPNQSSRMQYSNGKMSSSISYSYVLQAKEIGEFAIGGASILVNGKNYKANAVKIKVVKASKTSARGVRKQNQQKRNEGQNLKDYVFVKAIIDKRSAYVGEKVSLTYKLYSKLSLTGLNLEKLPALNGFWSKDIKTIYDQIVPKREQVNGEIYEVAELQRTVLYPQRSGELTIDPMEIKVTVQIKSNRRRSVFDQLFGSYESKNVIVSSKPEKVRIKALPTKGRPANFSGAVGSFKIQWQANKDSLKANEAIDLKIAIDGKGNLPLIGSPEIAFPKDFESYDPEVTNNYKTTYDGTSGSKIYKYLVIPRHSGDFLLEPYEFSYFDLNSKSYRTIKTIPLRFRVGKGDEENNVVYRGSRKEEVELLNSDIRYIHTAPSVLQFVDEMFYESALFYFLLFLAVILILFAYFYRKLILKRNKNFGKLRKAKANKIAKKRLASANKLLEREEFSGLYEEISTAIYGYFSDKFNIDTAELSQEKIIELLDLIPDSEEVVEEVQKVLEAAGMARFAPNSSVSARDLYNQAVALISKTENLEI